ncbi:hypothetical protein [Limnohabitans sp.]|uniref:hypothetical protein n=1 Tax=Limnohabitans sp. TaxID=1907725 RepID=UPI00286F822A|nr:hypothetical protein [Limnohabitans sp.]
MLKALSFSVCLCLSMAASAADFSFALWGDMPYGKNKDARQTQAVINSINRSEVAFSIFDGDFKDGSSRCDDAGYHAAYVMFEGMKKPTVYVPGDNEWTDCHRTNNGGYNSRERLSLIRRTFFSQPLSLGQEKMPLQNQGALGEKFSENTRFQVEGVVFLGLNVPGSNNNWVPDAKTCASKSVRTPADCEEANQEYEARNQANLAWLASSFAQATTRAAKGVVIVFQANPGFDLLETEKVDESQLPEYAGYQSLMAAVAYETAQFKGQVLLVHGDDHFFKMDKPLYAPSKLLNNFTRVQTFGSPSNHWVKVLVNKDDPEVFTIKPVIVHLD